MPYVGLVHDEPPYVDPNCTMGVQWIWTVFHECAVSTKDLCAVWFGIIAMVVWFIFPIPQIIENYRKKIPDQALSPYLLGAFVVADSLSLSGCILTNQLPLQIVLSVNAILFDIIFVCQFVYYKSVHERIVRSYTGVLEVSSLQDSGEMRSSSSSASASATLLCFTGLVCLTGPLALLSGGADAAAPVVAPIARQLLSVTPMPYLNPSTTAAQEPLFPNNASVAGYVLGWIAAIIYLMSRVPQIIKNWKRGTTEGVSPLIFFFALIGNTSYGLQIFLTSLDTNFIIRALPWIFGFPGVVIFDTVLCMQYLYYRGRQTYQPLQESDEPAAPSSDLPTTA